MTTNRMRFDYTDKVNVEVVDKDSEEVLARAEFDPADLPEDVQTKVLSYGLGKVLSDRTSDVKDKREKLDGMSAVFQMLTEGQWAKERQAGAPTVSAEVEALAKLKGTDIPTMQKSLKRYTKEQREAILSNPAVQAAAAEIRAARQAAESVELDDLLA